MRIPIKATAREPIKQAGYISATSAFYAQSLLRNAAGPYICAKSRTSACRSSFSKLRVASAARLQRPRTNNNYCAWGANCPGVRGCTRACGDVGTGLGVWLAFGRGGGDVFGATFRSEVLEMRRVICSWLALSCSTTFALLLAICSWPALSCSTPCSTFVRTRVISLNNCASSEDVGATAGALSCAVTGAEGATCEGAACAAAS